MNITRIALGVFLGNVLFAIVAGFITMVIVSDIQSRAQIKEANDSFAEFHARIQESRYQRCMAGRKAMDPSDAQKLPPCTLN